MPVAFKGVITFLPATAEVVYVSLEVTFVFSLTTSEAIFLPVAISIWLVITVLVNVIAPLLIHTSPDAA